MKHGKKPTVEQKKLLKKWKLDPEVWLIVKNEPQRMEIVHRYGNTRRVIPRG